MHLFFKVWGDKMLINTIVNKSDFYNSNTYILVNNGEILVIDPVDADEIMRQVEGLGRIVGVLVTHGHFDHCFGARQMQRLGYKIYMSTLDRDKGMDELAKEFNKDFEPFEVDVPLYDGDIAIWDFNIKVIHTPGHSKGSLCFIIEDNIFTGDTLFCNGVGRYDLYGGSFATLRNSLRNLFTLDNYKVYPGHNECTTIDIERRRLFGNK